MPKNTGANLKRNVPSTKCAAPLTRSREISGRGFALKPAIIIKQIKIAA